MNNSRRHTDTLDTSGPTPRVWPLDPVGAQMKTPDTDEELQKTHR